MSDVPKKKITNISIERGNSIIVDIIQESKLAQIIQKDNSTILYNKNNNNYEVNEVYEVKTG